MASSSPEEATPFVYLQPGQSTARAAQCRRFLFLDIDGVLNTTTMPGGCRVHSLLMKRLVKLLLAFDDKKKNDHDDDKEEKEEHQDKECMSLGIVFSSSWRLEEHYYSHFLQQLDRALLEEQENEQENGGQNNEESSSDTAPNAKPRSAADWIVGSTPELPIQALRQWTDGLEENNRQQHPTFGTMWQAMAIHRAYEITTWLQWQQQQEQQQTFSSTAQWAILDDLDIQTTLANQSASSLSLPLLSKRNSDNDTTKEETLTTPSDNDTIDVAQLRAVVEDHFVKTDPEAGLTQSNVKQVLDILNAAAKSD